MMFSFSRSLLLVSALVMNAACTSRTVQPLRTVVFASGLRGLSKAQVVEALGQPNDEDAAGSARSYWFLSEQSENSPQPTPVLYSFTFTGGKLTKVEPAAR